MQFLNLGGVGLDRQSIVFGRGDPRLTTTSREHASLGFGVCDYNLGGR